MKAASCSKTSWVTLALAAFFAVPILAIAVHIFNPDVQSWARLWDTTLPGYIFNTALLMLLVGSLSLLIGVSCAWFVTAYDFPGRKVLTWALALPIAAPAYIIAYIYADILEFYGPVQSSLRSIFGWTHGDYSFPSIRNVCGGAIVLSLVLYPYIYLLARASFVSQSQSEWWAARSLGLSPKSAFFKVVMPAARPAIIGGLALVLMETLSDFGVADFFSIPTFSVGIFRNWLVIGNKAAALNLASIMLLAVGLLVILEAGTRKGRVDVSGKTTEQSERIKPKKIAAWSMSLVCVLPVLLGLIIPVLRLIYHAVNSDNSVTQSHLWTYLSNSVGLALLVASIVLVMAIIFSTLQATGRFTPIATRIATLGYALPGALLAVGLLAPLTGLDKTLTRFAGETFGWQGGLILTGTLLALIYALTVRFLTVGFNAIDAGFAKIPPSMTYAARSLNAGRWRRLKTVTVPLLRPSLISAVILVFIDVIRELPATLILRPFNFETLATRVYWLASDEKLAQASGAALIVIAVGLIPTIFLNRFLTKEH